MTEGDVISLLIVDDDPCVREREQAFLEGTGRFSCATAVSAEDALLLLPGRFDAVVSDFEMPGLTGIAFLRVLRLRGISLPFVLYTGKSRDSVLEEALAAGASFYVRKGGGTRAEMVELAHAVRVAVNLRASSF
ncbi:MAG: response regulator [Methanofollis sp.]|uniref:response regulator n=1 Tax=Methanofollis sp. TaxID=2052835 RepID=UPI0026069D9D|nr:response regulator [Methanofollis sp.]MDD4254721.1 response regulator [Methanofollis sp.]